MFTDFIELADKKKDIYDSDIQALIENRQTQLPETWKLVRFHTTAGTGTIPTATLEMQHEDGRVVTDAATGDGPINAVFWAMERIIGLSVKLEDFKVSSVSQGKDALGEVSVGIRDGNRVFHGHGISTDIIEASAKAYLQALNKAIASA